jgi:hypothetical protein
LDISDDAFEAWLEYLFDRPPSDLEPTPWYHRIDDPPTEWTLRYEESDSPVAKAERIRRLFGDAGTLLRPYSDEQVGHGLNVIVNPACGGDIWVLAGGEIPSALRAAGLRSIVTLFAEVFAPRLRVAHPGYVHPWQHSESGQRVHPLYFVCYMFWDVAPLVPSRDDILLEVLEAKLEVLEATLALDSVACQRAALHGLGHEYFAAPDKVPEIIHRWLQRHPHAPDELRAYAVQATTGRVL